MKLGKKSGCLNIFNACKTASTGSALGSVGGWAQTVLQQRFGGFVAPLWAVEDEAAAVVDADLFEALVKRRLNVAQALLSIRQSYGTRSLPTSLTFFMATCTPESARRSTFALLGFVFLPANFLDYR